MRSGQVLVAASALAAIANAGFTVEEGESCDFYYGGKCGCNMPCVLNEAFAPCSHDAQAEFDLVAPLLQQCDAITSYFNQGRWSTLDQDKLCDVNSPCGALVPYIRNSRPQDRLCGNFAKYKYVIATFHGYCRFKDVAKISDDNGLLVSLAKKNREPSKPTPAPSRPVPAETPQVIPNPTTPAPVTTKATASPSTTSPPSTTNPPSTSNSPSNDKTDTKAKTASAASTVEAMGYSVWVGVTAAATYLAWTA